jgi:hypothetical protein
MSAAINDIAFISTFISCGTKKMELAKHVTTVYNHIRFIATAWP